MSEASYNPKARCMQCGEMGAYLMDFGHNECPGCCGTAAPLVRCVGQQAWNLECLYCHHAGPHVPDVDSQGKPCTDMQTCSATGAAVVCQEVNHAKTA